jgi:hypothetical protein
VDACLGRFRIVPVPQRYEVEGLIPQYGADAKLPDLLPLVCKLAAVAGGLPQEARGEYL